jgi:hypothetical protein
MRFLPLGLVILTGCNRYDLFRVTGYQQLSFSNRADVLFVIDNSESMVTKSRDMAENFSTFIQRIDSTQSTVTYEGLPDAVDNFVESMQNRSAFIDYSFSITTTDAETQQGELLGPTIKRGDPDVATAFISQLACDGTCFTSASPLPTDPDYQCGDPLDGPLSEEFMSCVCGSAGWGSCGASVEEGLESVYLALCRAVPNPPAGCYADVTSETTGDVYPALFNDNDEGTNEGMLRENAQFIPVIVSDEGDGSRREEDSDETPQTYEELFGQFGFEGTWVLIGNRLDEDKQVICPGAGSDWGVTRYHYMSHISDGAVIDMFEEPPPSPCNTRDFDDALNELSALLVNLLTSFQLQSVPVPGTIIVLVDGKVVDEAEITGEDFFGFDTYSDGWSYRSEDNSVVFHGAAIPDYNANVEVYYQPIDAMPRELPF